MTILDYDIEIDNAIIDLIVKALRNEQKLLALKFMKFRYEVGLKQAKDICDEVLGWKNGSPYFFIKDKKNIKNHIVEAVKNLKYKE